MCLPVSWIKYEDDFESSVLGTLSFLRPCPSVHTRMLSQGIRLTGDGSNCKWLKDGAYLFKGIFARSYEYAGKANLNRCY